MLITFLNSFITLGTNIALGRDQLHQHRLVVMVQFELGRISHPRRKSPLSLFLLFDNYCGQDLACNTTVQEEKESFDLKLLQ